MCREKEAGYTACGPDVRPDITAEDYIADIPMWTRQKNSLADIRKFLDALDVSEKNIIHVAGTNGKGSVCSYLTSILNASGLSTGTFISPHLCDVKERFLQNGSPVGEDDFTSTFDGVLDVVKRQCEAGLNHPAYFEFCFLIAMSLFTRKDVDIRILETGLGGRLDATNSVKSPLACVITSISLDHTRYLGDTIEEIAAEKAGIIKPGVPVIYDARDDRAARVIAEKARSQNAPAYPVCDTSSVPEGLLFTAPYQAVDAALAVRTLEVLNFPQVTSKTIYEGLLTARHQSRMEEIRPGIWLDGAHNPGGIAAFIEAVKRQEQQSGPFRAGLIFAVSNDKDYPLMIHLLCRELPLARVSVTAFEGERAADPEELGMLFLKEGVKDVRTFREPKEALLDALFELRDKDRLYAVGSLYLTGALRAVLSEDDKTICTGDLKNA